MSNAIHPFSDRASAILKYEPIELNGLVCYPIKVADYNKWQAVRPVLTMRQGTLPAVYACMTYLQCVWALQFDARMKGDTSRGTWDYLACVLFMSLRLSDMDTIQPIVDNKDPRNISSIRITKDGENHDISTSEFVQFRKLIAEQNGAELPDEADNPDLIEAANDISQSQDVKLKYDFSDMLTSVASEMKVRRADILDWTIKEFDDVMRSIKRRYGYFMASIAESNGAKFSHGNPYPTWIFDKEKDEFAGLIRLEKLQSDHHAAFAQSDNAPISTILKGEKHDPA